MIFLLDSNVISEWWKPSPDSRVMEWQKQAKWRLPVPVIAEISEGAEKNASPRRRAEIKERLSALVTSVPGAIVAWDSETAILWGELKHSPEVKRHPQSLWDSLIDAMGVRFDFTIATRNEKDFRHAKTFNPWTFSK